MYEYPLSAVTGAAPGDTVPVSQVTSNMAAGAYSTISDDGIMYVGTHDEEGPGEVRAYVEDRGEWVEQGKPFAAPRYAQGISVRGGVAYYTSSLGRGNDPGVSTLHAVDLATGREIGSTALPNMAEGVVATNHGLLVTYESGTSSYMDPSGSSFGDLLSSPSTTLTSYGEVGVVGLLQVETFTLRQAKQRFAQAQLRIEKIESRVGSLSLPATALGDVPLNAWFAGRLLTHLDTTVTWLENGNITADITRDALARAADLYDESDHSSQADLEKLLGLI